MKKEISKETHENLVVVESLISTTFALAEKYNYDVSSIEFESSKTIGFSFEVVESEASVFHGKTKRLRISVNRK